MCGVPAHCYQYQHNTIPNFLVMLLAVKGLFFKSCRSEMSLGRFKAWLVLFFSLVWMLLLLCCSCNLCMACVNCEWYGGGGVMVYMWYTTKITDNELDKYFFRVMMKSEQKSNKNREHTKLTKPKKIKSRVEEEESRGWWEDIVRQHEKTFGKQKG